MGRSILLYGGEVHTVNEHDEIVDAVLLRGGRIVYAGGEAGARLLAGDDVQAINLRGRAAVPGFVDAHVYMSTAGLLKSGRTDISSAAGVDSIERLLMQVRRVASAAAPDEWVFAQGYDPDKLQEHRHPTRVELDAAAPENPLLVIHQSGHMCVANTRALEYGGVLAGEGAYPPSHVIRDAAGEPTGLLIGSAHVAMMGRAPVRYSEDALLEGIARYQRQLAACGITSVHDGGATGADIFRALQRAKESGGLTCRCYPMLWTMFGKAAQRELIDTQIAGGFYTGLGDHMLKKGPIKLMMDTTPSGGTCATREPLGGGRQYAPALTQEELDELVMAAHRAHFQVTVQAAGDAAIDMVLNAYEKALTRYPRPNHRHRIEHAFLCSPDLATRMASLGVIPVSSPASIARWGKMYGKYYGERCSDIYPLGRYFEAGVICPFGSGAPTAPLEPLFAIAAAMERMDLQGGDLIAGAQALTLPQALRCATYYGAYASFEERDKGSLAVGKLADVAVLSGGLAGKDAAGVRALSVDMTILGGRVIYQREENGDGA